jgi:hypothetical protein
MEFQIVHKGIDSLYVSYRGHIKDGLLSDLERGKQLARSEHIQDQAESVMFLGDHNFEVLSKGSGLYSYVIEDNWFRISIAGVGSKRIPALYVQVRSELLNCCGVEDSMNKLRRVVDELLEGSYEEKISRDDIFIDFMADFDLSKIERGSWITKARNIQQYWDGGICTGWIIGRRKENIYARLYDKTAEIKTSNKDFFKALWLPKGWQEGQQVVRLEFVQKNDLLSQLGIITIEQLLDRMNDLWRMCTVDWLRIAINDGTENRTRWETEPVWEKIQQVMFNDNGYSGIKRKVSRSRSPNMKRLYINGLGYLLTYAALNGYDSSNLSEAARCFLRDAGMYLDACVLNDDKSKKHYSDSLDYVDKKINFKKKKLNRPDIGNDDIPF